MYALKSRRNVKVLHGQGLPFIPGFLKVRKNKIHGPMGPSQPTKPSKGKLGCPMVFSFFFHFHKDSWYTWHAPCSLCKSDYFVMPIHTIGFFLLRL